jgi:hypothetical protein
MKDYDVKINNAKKVFEDFNPSNYASKIENDPTYVNTKKF